MVGELDNLCSGSDAARSVSAKSECGRCHYLAAKQGNGSNLGPRLLVMTCGLNRNVTYLLL